MSLVPNTLRLVSLGLVLAAGTAQAGIPWRKINVLNALGTAQSAEAAQQRAVQQRQRQMQAVAAQIQRQQVVQQAASRKKLQQIREAAECRHETEEALENARTTVGLADARRELSALQKEAAAIREVILDDLRRSDRYQAAVTQADAARRMVQAHSGAPSISAEEKARCQKDQFAVSNLERDTLKADARMQAAQSRVDGALRNVRTLNERAQELAKKLVAGED